MVILKKVLKLLFFLFGRIHRNLIALCKILGFSQKLSVRSTHHNSLHDALIEDALFGFPKSEEVVNSSDTEEVMGALLLLRSLPGLPALEM